MEQTPAEQRNVPSANIGRIFLIDDHRLFREGLKRIFAEETDLVVCGEATNSKNVFVQIPQMKPNLILIDISLPGMDGLELVKSLRTQYPQIWLMILSMHDEELYAERALRAGAKGYITKRASITELLSAIRTVLKGEIFLSSACSKRLIYSLFNQRAESKKGIEQLSDRELEIFRLVGEGFTTGEIAQSLSISIKTVEAHRGNIKQKLKLGSSAELLRMAIAHSKKT
ncbi:MAG: DNA-binding response regulator [Verrucomicrobia bacterium]|nr:MAG: DNA-binding response regulator [Verrucomicrobiota bacterium]